MPAAPTARPNPFPRLLLALLALSYTVQGAWALFAPRAFYDNFPGLGRHWVSVDGPFNEHLVRDVGALSLSLVVVLIAAAMSRRPVIVRTAACAALVFGLPHLLYHATHLDTLSADDAAASLVTLGLGAMVPIAVLVLAAPRRSASRLLSEER